MLLTRRTNSRFWVRLFKFKEFGRRMHFDHSAEMIRTS
jgi:hypothetical protein